MMRYKKIQPLSMRVKSPPKLTLYMFPFKRGMERLNREMVLRLSLLPNALIVPSKNCHVCQNAWMYPVSVKHQKISKTSDTRYGITQYGHGIRS